MKRKVKQLAVITVWSNGISIRRGKKSHFRECEKPMLKMFDTMLKTALGN